MLRSELQQGFAAVTFNDTGRTLSGQALIDFLLPHDAAIVALERIDAALLDALPGLRIISKYGVGLDNVDLRAAAQRSIRVGWAGGVNRRSVAELVIAFAIAALRGVRTSHEEVRGGVWRQIRGRQLSDAVVGLVGFGHVGQEVARLLRGFGSTVIAHDVRDVAQQAAALDVELLPLEALVARADVVSLHVPHTPATAGLFDAERIGRMRDRAILINTARGGLVDEQAALTALTEGRLAAACFDVFATEPPDDRRLFEVPGFIGTAHIGGSSQEAVLAMGRAAIAGLLDARDPLSFIPDYLTDAVAT